MTARDLKRYRSGAYDPFQHNRAVRRRKQYRALVAATERAMRILHKRRIPELEAAWRARQSA